MLVFWKQKLVFLSVPKTGTTAFQHALAPHADIVILDPPQLKHAPLYRYNRFFRPMFEKAAKTDDMETLAVVREPISWLGSWYRYRRRPGLESHRNSTHKYSFDNFVLAYIQPKPPAYANVGSQAKFLEPRPNGTAVTHLFRYENQDALLEFLQNRLGVEFTMPRMNVSPDIPLQLSAEVEQRLRQHCAAEFTLWNAIAPTYGLCHLFGHGRPQIGQ